MAQKDATFTGSIPEIYERCLGPMFFRPYADDIAARAQVVGARRILEVAAGTGIATQAVAAVSPAAEIEATDLNGAMVNLAAARHHNEKVRWSIADASALPFEAGRFDLVICQFGVMFFPDRQQAFREARRVLTPDGTYLFNVWDSVKRNDVARITSETVEALFPDNPPDFVRRVPHGHGDPDAIESDLRAAGFSRNHMRSRREAQRCLCARRSRRNLRGDASQARDLRAQFGAFSGCWKRQRRFEPPAASEI